MAGRQGHLGQEIGQSSQDTPRLLSTKECHHYDVYRGQRTANLKACLLPLEQPWVSPAPHQLWSAGPCSTAPQSGVMSGLLGSCSALKVLCLIFLVGEVGSQTNSDSVAARICQRDPFLSLLGHHILNHTATEGLIGAMANCYLSNTSWFL